MPRNKHVDSKNSKRKEHGRRIYAIWLKMKSRCFNESDKAYCNYGSRGISVCDEWVDDFTLFYEWSLSNGYAEKLTIDRIDNNKNYEPNNCRWATRTVQARNKRDNVMVEINGITKLAVDWEREYGITERVIYKRIKNGYTGEDLLKESLKKLTKVDVLNIDRIMRETQLNNREISELFNVNVSTIRRIRNGQLWQSVTGRARLN